MNRTEVIAGSAIAVLAAIGIGQLYHDRGALQEPASSHAAEVFATPPAPAETLPVTVDEVISNFITSLEQDGADQKTAALTGLLDELDSPTYAKARLSSEPAARLSQAVLSIVSVSTEGQTSESLALRSRAAALIAGRTRGEASKQFALQALRQGPAELREQVARHAGLPHGVGGKELFEAVRELGERGEIPGTVLPGSLRRLGGKKALEPIIAVMKGADHWKTIQACVVALQDYHDPALLTPALERLDQTGLLDKPEKLPWINSKLFAQYIEAAEGTPLTRGLRAARTRPSLVKVSLEAVKRGLEKGEPETRRVSAEAVRKAVVAKIIDAKQGEGLLAGRLDRETEPVLKAELTGGLEQVRELMPREPQSQQ